MLLMAFNGTVNPQNLLWLKYTSTFLTIIQFQFEFRPFHSTETALVKKFNGLLVAADSGLFTIHAVLQLLILSSQISLVQHNTGQYGTAVQ